MGSSFMGLDAACVSGSRSLCGARCPVRAQAPGGSRAIPFARRPVACRGRERGDRGPPAVPCQPAPQGWAQTGVLSKCESGADFERGPEVWPRQYEEKDCEPTRARLHLGPGSWRGLAASHLGTHTRAGWGRAGGRLQSSRCAQRPVSFPGRREARLESASIPVWGLSAARVGPVGRRRASAGGSEPGGGRGGREGSGSLKLGSCTRSAGLRGGQGPALGSLGWGGPSAATGLGAA